MLGARQQSAQQIENRTFMRFSGGEFPANVEKSPTVQ
jgi:hypothetical protein